MMVISAILTQPLPHGGQGSGREMVYGLACIAVTLLGIWVINKIRNWNDRHGGPR